MQLIQQSETDKEIKKNEFQVNNLNMERTSIESNLLEILKPSFLVCE